MATPLNELTTGDRMEGVGTPNVDDLSDDVPLIMPPDSVEAVSSVPITYGKRKRRSSVWEGFKVIPRDKYDDRKERAECLKCNIVYRTDTCINGIGILRRHLKNYPKHDNKDVKQMMLVFDPRYKFAFVDWAFKKIALLDPLVYDMSLRVKNTLVRLFTAYKTMDVASIEASTPSFSYTGPAELEKFSTFDSAVLIDKYGKFQLVYYLKEPKLSFDDKYRRFDVLAYWRQNGLKYLNVASKAKYILSIPVSTVASESAFSAGGRFIDKYHSKLLPSNVEAFICLRDYMFDIDFRAEPVDDAEDVALALGNVLITNDLPMPANLVASIIRPSSFAATLMANG
ncbi:hypothetical protein NE237_012267 [Protea cynaroides]|uniref:BED-type domain-containing protein n=1 Tax=Protea cynaroides TaxID=273540 RepID=A0A9Q0GXL9_9MAGN|nr:hypothetical protein NE237_012267 [Protea cynaroides]